MGELLRRRAMMAAGGEEDDPGISVEWTTGVTLKSSGNVNTAVGSGTGSDNSAVSSPFACSPGQTVTITNTDPEWDSAWSAIMFFQSGTSGNYIYPRKTGSGRSFSAVAPNKTAQCRVCFHPTQHQVYKLDTMRVYVE